MSAYRKFSSVLQRETHAPPLPKLPKPPKVDPIGAETLGGLGGLDTAEPETRNSAPPSPADRTLATWGEAEEERAAIVEYDGGIPRAWAEGFARLDPDRPPGDLPPVRWRRFVDDVGLFLDRWAAYAAALGWRPYDLFGCDRDRPLARLDRAGLIWLLNGDRLVMLADDAATIETRTGARQIFRRKPGEPGRVLAWELAA
jgi:hypothetical protein